MSSESFRHASIRTLVEPNMGSVHAGVRPDRVLQSPLRPLESGAEALDGPRDPTQSPGLGDFVSSVFDVLVSSIKNGSLFLFGR